MFLGFMEKLCYGIKIIIDSNLLCSYQIVNGEYEKENKVE